MVKVGLLLASSLPLYAAGFDCAAYVSTCKDTANYKAYGDCAATVAANEDGMTCRTTHLGLASADADAATIHCPHAQEAATGPCATETLVTPAGDSASVSSISCAAVLAALLAAMY